MNELIKITRFISLFSGFISLSIFMINMYKGAMVLGVLKVCNESNFIQEDNEVVISERKKLKSIKENIIVSGSIIFSMLFLNIIILLIYMN